MSLIRVGQALFQAPVELVAGEATGRVVFRIRQQLRQNVIPIERQALGESTVGLDHHGVVRGVAALVAILYAGDDVVVLRERPQCLVHRTTRLNAGIGEVGIGDRNVGGVAR